ncbi:MAG: Inner membrane protein YqiK [uncultured Thiotrichaceae bacterium]|uniref:Inner membrane protein YqiK n=1 Tax=uncultured Thiotrichaceae bacterium TaxID=298394 RepID=A0A6S6SNB0_9GAMM|nr:MAG: Inner membrane protein YqiK [uncultured Thiotrichaceae bacterium]
MSDLYLFLVVALVVVLLLTIALFAAFYRRASKDKAFVRTGLGGERVIVNSGAFVFPVLHDTVQINMQTLRVEIERNNKLALITEDPLRVDVVAEFFLRVAQDDDAISIAARTLGSRTMDPEQVKDIVEAQCVAALRSVASTMTLDELHVKRTDFEHNVENTLNAEFEKNGMELVSVSLMRLDQTSREYFDENNSFDARGLIHLDEVTESSKKRRNDIEQDTKIKIQEKNKETEKQRLSIEQQQIEFQKEQEKYLADLNASTAKDIEEIQLQREREIEEIKIAKTVALDMARQDMDVARAQFDQNVAEAWMSTDKIKAEAARLTEEISTAREKAEAERIKLVEIIRAQKDASRQTIIAEANAEVERLAAKAAEIRYQVEAAGKSALNSAANLLDNKQIDMQVKMEIVRQLPQIIKESVRPLENIDGIKIMHLDGLGSASGGSVSSGGGKSGSGGGNGGGGGLADQVVDSALRYRAQVPLIDSLLKEVDLKGDSSAGLTDFIRHQMESSGDFEQSKGKVKKSARVADDIEDYDEPVARSAPEPSRKTRSHDSEIADDYAADSSIDNVIDADPVDHDAGNASDDNRV